MEEAQAIEETINKLEKFRTQHGAKALADAIKNGAFIVHPDYGDVSYTIRTRDFDHNTITVPLWVTDMFNFNS